MRKKQIIIGLFFILTLRLFSYDIPNKLILTAYHEAAQALIGILNGFSVKKISISDSGDSGLTTFSNLPGEYGSTKEYLKGIEMWMSGIAGENGIFIFKRNS